MPKPHLRPLAARLRASVLQQAVEGKLVPQDPSDEPAAALLERVREERAELVRQKKAKAPKGGESRIWQGADGSWYEQRGKGEQVCIDDEIPFDIPESWEWARLSDLCEFGSCDNVEYDDVPVGTWNLDLEDLERDSGRILRRKLKQAGDKGSTKHAFKAGMVLYSKLRPYLNKVTVVDEDGVCTSEILPLEFCSLSSQYAMRFFMSPYYLNLAKSHVSGVKMPRLRVNEAKMFLVPVPPLAEQKRIVARIDEIMPLVDKLEEKEQALEKLDERFFENLPKTILQQAVQGKLVPQDPADEPTCALLERVCEARDELVRQKKAKAPKGGHSRIWQGTDGSWYEQRGKGDPVCIDDEIPFDIPESWEWVRLIDFAEAIVDCPHSTPKYHSDGEDTGYYAIDTNCMDDEWRQTGSRNLSEKDYLERIKRLKPVAGDVILSREASIGRVVILKDDKHCLGQRVMLIRCGSFMCPEFLQIVLSSPYCWAIYRRLNQGTGAKHINVSCIKSLLIPVPPLSEQSRIVCRTHEVRVVLKEQS